MKRRAIAKPFSEMSHAEKRRAAEDAIANLTHAHNRYDRTCQEAAERWRQIIRELDAPQRALAEDWNR